MPLHTLEFPVPPSSPFIVHCSMLCLTRLRTRVLPVSSYTLTASNVSCRFVLVACATGM